MAGTTMMKSDRLVGKVAGKSGMNTTGELRRASSTLPSRSAGLSDLCPNTLCSTLALIVAAVAGTAAPAMAQPAGPGGINFWLNPVNGSWYDSLAWGGVIPSQGGVPDAITTASLPGATAYQVDMLGGTAQCHHLSLGNSQATLRVAGIGSGNATSLVINGTQWDSQGTVLVGGPGIASPSVVRINNNITIGGSGTLRLDAQGLAQTAFLSPTFNQGWLLINGAQHTISGNGILEVRLQNEGLIRADIPSRAMSFQSSFMTTNNATISASNGASVVLNTSGGVTQSAGGQLFVGSGSELTIANVGTPGLTGGSITTQGTGRVLIATQGAKLNDVRLTSGSLLTFLGNSGVFIGPLGLQNFGTISTGPQGFVTSDFAGTTTISGTGRLQMEGGELGRFGSGAGYAMTSAADHTIGGRGTILLTLTNFGTVLADRNGQSTGPTDLVLQQGTKFNSGSMIARNGGLLRLQQNVIVDQTTFGILRAEDASAVLIESATVIGGRLASSGSGAVSVFGGGNVIDGVRITAGSRAVVNCSATLLTRNTISIDGTLEIRNDGCGPNFATLQAALGAALNGGGTIRLLPTAGSTNVNIVSQGASAAPVGLGLGLTIAGQGTLSGPMRGQPTLSPDLLHLPVNQGGGPIGTLVASPGAGNTFAMQNPTRFECDIASASSFDRVTINGAGAWNGTVHARFLQPFVPSFGSAFDVLTATTLAGTAGVVTAEGLPPDRTVRVELLPDRLRLTIIGICTLSDIASPGPTVGPDGELSADDVILFINWFVSGDVRADIAGPGPTVGPDGELTADDIILFISRFVAGC
jgi:hypothetical protein